MDEAKINFMKIWKTLVMVVLLAGSVTVANAARFAIDRYVTAVGGCRFHIVGWIDVSWTGDVKHYDVTASGPCGGPWRFNARSMNPTTGLPTEDNEPIGTFEITVTDDMGTVATSYPFTDQEIMDACQ